MLSIKELLRSYLVTLIFLTYTNFFFGNDIRRQALPGRVGDSLDAVGRCWHTSAPVVVGLLRSLIVLSSALAYAKLGIFLGMDALHWHSCFQFEANSYPQWNCWLFRHSKLVSLAWNHRIWNWGRSHHLPLRSYLPRTTGYGQWQWQWTVTVSISTR